MSGPLFDLLVYPGSLVWKTCWRSCEPRPALTASRSGHAEWIVLSLYDAPGRVAPITQQLCANAHGFSPHAALRCAPEKRNDLERTRCYITRPSIANERQLQRNGTVSLGR